MILTTPVEQQELTFTDFGTGTFTQFVQDPTDATRTVASTTKGATAEEWAGTTIDAGAGDFPADRDSNNHDSAGVLTCAEYGRALKARGVG